MTESIDPYKNRVHRSDIALRYAFGTTDPKITAFPHCIFPSGEESLRSVVEVVHEPVGIWGNAMPFVDASGEPYVPPWDDPAINAKDFKLWKLPANQQQAMDYGGRLPDFIAAISCETPEEMLERMYRSDHGENCFDYVRCMRLLADWIEDLGWAYVPLEYQAEYALFVMARRNHSLLDQVKASLEAHGIDPVFEVASVDGRQTWTGPLYLVE